jgi:Flp pilus assembly protein TadD
MEAAFNLGSARLRSGDSAGAVAPLERAIRLRPSFAQAHALLGVARLALGDNAGAEVPLRRALELNPALADPVYYLGVAALERGDTPSATRLFAEFLRRPGGNQLLRDDARRALGATK